MTAPDWTRTGDEVPPVVEHAPVEALDVISGLRGVLPEPATMGEKGVRFRPYTDPERVFPQFSSLATANLWRQKREPACPG